MHDWEGSRTRAEAQQVPCRYCLVPAGKPCRAKSDPSHEIAAFPAHPIRVNDSQKAIAAAVEGSEEGAL